MLTLLSSITHPSSSIFIPKAMGFILVSLFQTSPSGFIDSFIFWASFSRSCSWSNTFTLNTTIDFAAFLFCFFASFYYFCPPFFPYSFACIFYFSFFCSTFSLPFFLSFFFSFYSPAFFSLFPSVYVPFAYFLSSFSVFSFFFSNFL